MDKMIDIMAKGDLDFDDLDTKSKNELIKKICFELLGLERYNQLKKMDTNL